MTPTLSSCLPLTLSKYHFSSVIDEKGKRVEEQNTKAENGGKTLTEWEIMEGGKKWRTLKGKYYSIGFTKGVFLTYACWKHRIGCMPASAIPKALLSLKLISFSLGLAFAVVLLWFGVFHPFVTFLAWHHAYRQVFMPVNLLCFPQVTLWISIRKNTKSPICFFITQRINTKWGSLLSCHTGKPPHYSASNKHLLRVNKSSVWLSLCREWLTIQGNPSLRKKK